MSKHPFLAALVPGALAVLVSACGAEPQAPSASSASKSDAAAADATCREGKELRPTGGDDTALLQAALDRCVPGGRDCTVKLGKGVFKTRQLAVTGFHGSLGGAGMHETVIEPYGILDVSQDLHFFIDGAANPPGPDHLWPVLLSFWKGSDARVEGLTFRVTEPDPTVGWHCGPDCDGPAWVTWLKAAVMVEGSARFDRVGFVGGPGSDSGVTNLDDGLGVGWLPQDPQRGLTVEVTRCRFSNAGNSMDFAGLSGARLIVGGSAGAGNVIEGGNGGIFENLDATVVDYSFNHVSASVPGGLGIGFLNSSGILWPMTLTAPTRFHVHHNAFVTTSPGISAISWYDDLAASAGTRSIEAVVSHNRIELAGDPQSNVGIYAIASEGDVVSHNRITGAGYAGIDMYYTGNALLEHNDVSGVTAAAAPILLDEGSHECTAIVKDAASVLDLGTGNQVIVRQ